MKSNPIERHAPKEIDISRYHLEDLIPPSFDLLFCNLLSLELHIWNGLDSDTGRWTFRPRCSTPNLLLCPRMFPSG